MRVAKLTLTLVGLIALSAAGFSAHAAETVLPVRVLGSSKAPVTLHEYSSLTCSHCATFHNETLLELQKRYIDTGKVRLVLHNFPLDGNALKAAALAQCMTEERYFPFVSLLFKNIMQWAIGGKTDQTLIQYAKLAGLSDEKAKSCLTDTKILDAIVAERTNDGNKHDIHSTPTFIIGETQEKIIGGRSVDDFAAALDRALAAKH